MPYGNDQQKSAVMIMCLVVPGWIADLKRPVDSHESNAICNNELPQLALVCEHLGPDHVTTAIIHRKISSVQGYHLLLI